MTRLAMRSLREQGQFNGDVILFTDSPDVFSVAETTGDVSQLVTIDVVGHLARYPGLVDYPRDWARLFKPFMADYFDFSAYNKVIYLDSDILCAAPIEPLFEHMADERFYFTFSAWFGWIDASTQPNGNHSPFLGRNFDLAHLQQSDLPRWSETGVCAGVFGMRSECISQYLMAWKARILAFVAEGITASDQMALNELLLQGDIDGAPFHNEWVSYPMTALVGRSDRRHLGKGSASQTGFILYHFNPLSAELKLKHMRAFRAFGADLLAKAQCQTSGVLPAQIYSEVP